MVTFGGVKEREYTLIEQGEYVLTLSELEESEGQYGERMVWKFLVAPREDFSAYICRDDGNEKTVWVFTDRDIIVGSQCQELIEVLTGRTFEKGGEPPSEDDLLGKRCIGYITHETPTRGKNAGKKREKIVEGSLKPFKGPAKTIAANAPAKAPPTGDDARRVGLVSRLEKLIGKAVKLETPNHAAFVALDLAEGDADQLEQLCASVQTEITAALDA